MTKSETKRLAAVTDMEKLLDNGHAVIVFRNALGSHTAFAVPCDHVGVSNAAHVADDDGKLVDGFTVDQAVSMLAEKMNELESENDKLKAENDRLTGENGRLWNHQTRTEAGHVKYVEADGEDIYTIDDGVPLTRSSDE